MITRDNNIGLVVGSAGVIVQSFGPFVVDRGDVLPAIAVGTVLLTVGLAFHARAKAHGMAWGVFGLLGLVGVLVVMLLDDRAPEPGGVPYEFDEQQDEVVASLARAMVNVSMLTLLGSAGALVQSMLLFLTLAAAGERGLAVLGLIGSGGEIFIAAMLVGAGRTLLAIPRTEGEDMPNLMSGLRKLSNAYLMQAITMAALVALVVIAVVRAT